MPTCNGKWLNNLPLPPPTPTCPRHCPRLAVWIPVSGLWPVPRLAPGFLARHFMDAPMRWGPRFTGPIMDAGTIAGKRRPASSFSTSAIRAAVRLHTPGFGFGLPFVALSPTTTDDVAPDCMLNHTVALPPSDSSFLGPVGRLHHSTGVDLRRPSPDSPDAGPRVTLVPSRNGQSQSYPAPT